MLNVVGFHGKISARTDIHGKECPRMREEKQDCGDCTAMKLSHWSGACWADGERLR